MDYINGRKFLDQLSDYQFHKKVFAPLSYLIGRIKSFTSEVYNFPKEKVLILPKLDKLI